MAQIVELKDYILRQMDLVIDFVRDHTARKNGTETELFNAKEGEENSNVVINQQLSNNIDTTISETNLKQLWDVV